MLGLTRDPAVLREEAERRRSGRAGREAGMLRGALRDLEGKRERLMNLVLDGPFGKDEVAWRAATLDAERAAVRRELDVLGGEALEERLREFEELSALIEEYLRDLPDLVGRRRVMRDHVTIPAARTPENPRGIYRPSPDRIRRKTAGEIEGERLAADNEGANRLRFVYEAIGLAVTAHKDGTLVLRWSLGERVLPTVTRSESPVLGRILSAG